MSGLRLRVTAPTRPARESLLGFLTGLDEQPSGYWVEACFAEPLRALREACGERVAVAFEDGGLLQSLDAWRNVLLPVSFHAAHDSRAARLRAQGILAAVGRRPEDFMASPAQLSLFEKRLIGFVKAAVLEPQLLVIDRLFEELGHEEQKSIASLLELFHRRYPLRRMLYVGLSESPPGLLAGFEPLEREEAIQ